MPKPQWFNQQQAKLASVGRLWSYAGLVVWFKAMWTLVYRTEPFILTCIPFICVTHACPICIFEENSEPSLHWCCCCESLYLDTCICCIVFQTSMKRKEQGHCSVLITTLIWLLLLSVSPLHQDLSICWQSHLINTLFTYAWALIIITLYLFLCNQVIWGNLINWLKALCFSF